MSKESANRTVRMIAVGDELLEGRTADTNSGRIQRALGQHSVQVGGIQVVPDTQQAIMQALDRTAVGDIVFMTGGLGSTPDDISRDGVAAWAGVDLPEDVTVRKQLEKRWARLGRKAGVGVQRQCQVPDGMQAMTNPVGSAPGLTGELKGRILVLLPGVPEELLGLLPLAVAWLNEQGFLPEERQTLLWRTGQIAELSLVRKLEDVVGKFPGFQWSWWLTPWGVDVRVAADINQTEILSQLSDLEKEVTGQLGSLVYSRKMHSLPEVVQFLMLKKNLTLSVAESCTAGMIGARMTDLAGSSGFFRGGILAYADPVKHNLLDVPLETLDNHGAVSQSVVVAMAEGAKKRLGTDYSIAVSGISGPGGGTDEKPVGTTWVAVATPERTFAGLYRFPADRERNRLLTVAVAVDSLRRSLEFGPMQSPWNDDNTWCLLSS